MNITKGALTKTQAIQHSMEEREPSTLARVIDLLRSSSVKQKSSGESGSSWRTPLTREKYPTYLPFTNTDSFTECRTISIKKQKISKNENSQNIIVKLILSTYHLTAASGF
jgi:hypothetical protein